MADSDSILNSIKKLLGIVASDTTFDLDIIMYINSSFSTLEQLGVGPTGGFMIEDATAVWDDFLGTDPRKNMIKTYIGLNARLLFDPPTTAHMIEMMKEQKREMEVRISINRENEEWTDPTLEPPPDGIVLDGGEA